MFICLDNIQYNKGGWQNRNKIKTPGGPMLLTVPVHAGFQKNLNEITINNQERWAEKHHKALMTYYSKAPFFKKYFSFFEEAYAKTWTTLNELNFHCLYFFLRALGIKTKLIKGSELPVSGIATERLVNVCRAAGADTYLCGDHAAKVYLDETLFVQAGIRVALQNWDCPAYSQLFPEKGFIPDLSIVDLLFNHGEDSLNILQKKEKKEQNTP